MKRPNRVAAVATAAILSSCFVVSGCALHGDTVIANRDSQAMGAAPTGADQYRILPPVGYRASCPQGYCAIPPSPSIVVKDGAGMQVGLLIDPDLRTDDPRRMAVRVCPHTAQAAGGSFDMGQCRTHMVGVGDAFADLGLHVEVQQLWWMTDPKNDALDAVVTPAAQ